MQFHIRRFLLRWEETDSRVFFPYNVRSNVKTVDSEESPMQHSYIKKIKSVEDVASLTRRHLKRLTDERDVIAYSCREFYTNSHLIRNLSNKRLASFINFI